MTGGRKRFLQSRREEKIFKEMRRLLTLAMCAMYLALRKSSAGHFTGSLGVLRTKENGCLCHDFGSRGQAIEVDLDGLADRPITESPTLVAFDGIRRCGDLEVLFEDSLQTKTSQIDVQRLVPISVILLIE